MSLKLGGRGRDTPTNSTKGGAGTDQLNLKWQDGGGGGGLDQLNPKFQDLSESTFLGRGEGVVVQTNSTQSAKSYSNLHWGGGWSRPTQPKVARSVQICIFGEEEGGGGGPDQLNPKW